MPKKQKLGPFRPVFNEPEDREKAIMNDTPALFEIERNFPIDLNKPILDEVLDNAYTFDSYGRDAVNKHDKPIMKHAQKHNLDPDLIRSVMFAENARGHKFGLNKWADNHKKSDSPLPMNVQKNRWSPLIGKHPDDLYDADNNIEAATILLKRISNRVNKPTPAKVGSIWHYTGREKTNEFGEYIGRVYEEKPWRKID